ncbi:MAG: BON domain-containing protein [Betaproteobacteria bacterium]|nr:BON domain-containing protein [Betaproteobacteria bacterium]
MNTSKTIAAISAVLLAVGLSACDKYTSSGETVGQKVDKAIDKTNEKVANVGDKVGATVDKAGSTVANVAGSVSDKAAETTTAINDGTITASINADLVKDPDLSVLKIDVDTREGVVSLNGLVKDEASRLRAGTIASGIKGVRQVNNHLVVKKV